MQKDTSSFDNETLKNNITFLVEQNVIMLGWKGAQWKSKAKKLINTFLIQ